MERKRIYVAGAYSADNVMDVLQNMGRGIKASAHLFRKGFAPFCPWLDYHYVLDDPNADIALVDFYEYSLAWLAVSDALYILPNHENSNGTKNEIAFAEKRHIPVFYSYGTLLMHALKNGWIPHPMTETPSNGTRDDEGTGNE